YIVPSVPNYRDVVINEIFADPSPMIGLPDGEFIEIYNASSAKYFDLKDWQITDGSSTSTLPSYTLAPDSYVILYSTSTSGDFSIYTKKIAVSSFPSLNNAGDVIELLDDNGNQIDLVEYDNSMYQDAIKDDGGWTLEQINPQANCYNPANWIASNNSNGGTPTQLNSVNDLSPDLESPQLISALAITNSTIEIEISKPIDTAQLFRNLTLSAGRSVMSYTLLDSFGTKFSLSVSPALDTGVVYFLSVDSLTDCEGNFSQTSSEIVLADRNVAGSVILNEILFNPYTGDEDFVELYNNSDLYIDLFGWSLGNDDNGSAGNFKTIDQHYLLKPKEYVFVTKNKVAIIARYSTNSPEKSIEIETLPTYSNESGTVYILTPSGTESDKFDYDEDMHFSLLRNVDGVSLERLNFDRPTQDKTNWHSAAEEVGFATPGVQNSQFTPVASSTSTLSVSPELFSPDNDGFEDILSINYIMTEPGFVGNVSIYDSRGRIIKSLIKNQLLAKKGSFAWDGTNENGTKARIGRYVILFEFYDLDGNVKTEKTTCVVAHKL
ncbi:MAG: lamin tail domain-containing protein, partial [Flavobacteriales bacterium]